jgi:hypothetical protein
LHQCALEDHVFLLQCGSKQNCPHFCHQISSFATWLLITTGIVSQCLQIMEHKNQQQNKRRRKSINVLYSNKENNKTMAHVGLNLVDQ